MIRRSFLSLIPALAGLPVLGKLLPKEPRCWLTGEVIRPGDNTIQFSMRYDPHAPPEDRMKAWLNGKEIPCGKVDTGPDGEPLGPFMVKAADGMLFGFSDA